MVLPSKEFYMLKFLKKSSRQAAGNSSSENSDRKDNEETKKCLNCLRRVETHWERCPHCRHSNFAD